jgi:hypothetical protein
MHYTCPQMAQFRALACLSGLLLSIPSAQGAAFLERQATVLEKKYDNGNSVRLSCNNPGRDRCTLSTRINGRHRSITLSSLELGGSPTLEMIRLFAYEDNSNAYSLIIGIVCSKADEKLAGDASSAICESNISVDNDLLRPGVEIQVRPITSESLWRTK